VHNHGWLAGWVATRFPIDEVPIADVQQPLVVRFYFGIELRHVLGQVSSGTCEPGAESTDHSGARVRRYGLTGYASTACEPAAIGLPPPQTSTRPSSRVVPVASQRASRIGATDVHAARTGSKTSAVASSTGL
jgi:hypothetical protein